MPRPTRGCCCCYVAHLCCLAVSPHYTYTLLHTALAACYSAHPLQNCYDDVQLHRCHMSCLLPSRLASHSTRQCTCPALSCRSQPSTGPILSDTVLGVSAPLLRLSGTNFRHTFELWTLAGSPGIPFLKTQNSPAKEKILVSLAKILYSTVYTHITTW